MPVDKPLFSSENKLDKEKEEKWKLKHYGNFSSHFHGNWKGKTYSLNNQPVNKHLLIEFLVCAKSEAEVLLQIYKTRVSYSFKEELAC